MAERLKARAWKVRIRRKPYRGFESHSLRQLRIPATSGTVQQCPRKRCGAGIPYVSSVLSRPGPSSTISPRLVGGNMGVRSVAEGCGSSSIGSMSSRSNVL